MGRAVPLIAVLLCLAALATGCTVGPSQRPAVAVRGENMPPRPTPTEQQAPADVLPEPREQNASIPFFDCTEETLAATAVPLDRTLRVECGQLTVPADPDRSDLEGISLGVVRVGLADAPRNRQPLLAVGDSAGEPSARHAVVLASQVDPSVLQRYTLVGLDRRGAGEDLLDCAEPAARAALVDADTASSEADLAELLERARTVVQDCTIDLNGSGLGSYRTASTARDVDLLRAGLGVDRLSAIGVGDGAAALAGWARAAPGAVGRLVLDGPPHPTLDEPELGESRAAAAEAAFGAFAVACSVRPDCPLGADPRATVTGLVERLRVQPVVAVDGRRLTAGATLTALLAGLGEPRGWPALTAALAAAAAGDPAPLLAALDPLTGVRGRFDGMLATECNDTRRRLAPGETAELAARWRAVHPLFGATQALRLVDCAPWPTGGAPAAAGRADGAPPIVVIGTAADPRGPLEGSRRAAEGLASARFLSWQGAGTGAYPRSPCVSGAVDAMLLDGVVPAAGTLCPP